MVLQALQLRLQLLGAHLGVGLFQGLDELACAISAKIQGVNPFDQPGVETYKQNIKSML